MRWSLRQTAAFGAIVILLTASSACAKDPRYSPTTLSPAPSRNNSSGVSSPTSTSAMSDRSQIRSLYNEFAVKSWSAETLPKERRRAYLAKWMIDPALSRFVNGMERLRRRGQRDVGIISPHVFAISIHGNSAQVQDCSDDSGLRTVNSAGKTIDRGKRNTWYVTSLRRTANGWRVYDARRKEQSCVRE